MFLASFAYHTLTFEEFPYPRTCHISCIIYLMGELEKCLKTELELRKQTIYFLCSLTIISFSFSEFLHLALVYLFIAIEPIDSKANE